jgi:hypothetical protein
MATLDDLLAPVIEARGITAWCKAAGIRPWTLLRLRDGDGERTHRGTVLAIARKLRLPETEVAAAIAASRRAKRRRA